MIQSVVLIAFVVAGYLLYRLARGPNLVVQSVDDVVGMGYPIDLQAFATLNDPEDQRFLFSTLPPEQLQRYVRSRKRLQRAYLIQIMDNCALLMRLAEGAHGNPQLSAAARDLKETALNCRLNALKALALLYFGGAAPAAAGLTTKYEAVRAKFSHYCMMSAPTMTSRALQVV